MLADELYARPLGRSNFAQLPQKGTHTELIDFIAKRFIHCDSVPLSRSFASVTAPAFRVAHASRVLAMTSRHRGLFLRVRKLWLLVIFDKVRFGETPKPTRETRALPGEQNKAADSSARFTLDTRDALDQSQRHQ